MKKLVRIKYLPKAVEGMNVTGKINNMDGSMHNQKTSQFSPFGHDHEEGVNVNRTLKPTDRENATLEAEKGETVVTNLAKTGIPEFYTVGGKRHSSGGTPLNLPADSFIFSRDRKMVLKDSDILSQFGKNVKDNNKKGFTFAELSKKYDVNPYRKILADPTSDMHQIKTAELMIQNYVLKLGGLAMVQESVKGFPNGIPGVAMPYLEHTGMDPANFFDQSEEQELPQMRYGGTPQFLKRGVSYFQQGGPTNNIMNPLQTPLSESSYTTGLPEGARVTSTGDVVNAKGTIIGRINMPQTSSKTTKYQNIPKDANRWDMSKPGYDESKVTPEDYVKQSDGKWHKVTGYKQKNYDFKDERLGDLQSAYGHLQNTITTDEALQEAVYNNYKKHIEASDLPKIKKDVLLNKKKADVISNLLQAQKQIYAINNAGLLYDKDKDGNIKLGADNKPILKSEKDLKSWETKGSDKYKEAMNQLKFTKDEIMDEDMTAMFEASYRGLADAKHDPAFAEKLANYDLNPIGLKDTHGKHTYKNLPISPTDGMFGNTVAGQAMMPKNLAKSLESSEVEWSDKTDDSNIKHVQDQMRNQRTPFWTEDDINLGFAARNYLTIPKNKPWNAVPNVHLPNPVFQTPDQQIQNILSGTRMGVMGAGAFGSPQQYAANFTGIHGNASDQVANAIGQVRDRNVATANEFELQRARIINTANSEKSQLATNLHDKNAMFNEKFYSDKTHALDVFRKTLVNRWTNRGMTQNMNASTDQFQIDPRTGYKYFTNPQDITPNPAKDMSIARAINEIKGMVPGISDDVAYRTAIKQLGLASDATPGYAGVAPDATTPSYYPKQNEQG